MELLRLRLSWVLVLLLLGSNFLETQANVQFYWYPVPVKFATSPATVLRRTPGQSVHFEVRNTDDGTYHFGYDADTLTSKSFREERRDEQGRVRGSYGYVDPQGQLRVVEYIADEGGFRTISSKKSPAVYTQPVERIQIIGPIPRPLSEFFRY